MMLAWKVAPALACGNTVVLKPAEQTPLSAMYFGKLIQEAGLPEGVVNILPGLGAEAGKPLAEHTGVDKIAFTGSTNTGRAIMRSAATNLKNITLECGGKSPSIVFADAELDQAVKWTHMGIMGNQGEVSLMFNTFLSPDVNRPGPYRSAQQRVVFTCMKTFMTSSCDDLLRRLSLKRSETPSPKILPREPLSQKTSMTRFLGILSKERNLVPSY